MSPHDPIPGDVYDAALRVVTGTATAADRDRLAGSGPDAMTAALAVLRRAAERGAARECRP